MPPEDKAPFAVLFFMFFPFIWPAAALNHVTAGEAVHRWRLQHETLQQSGFLRQIGAVQKAITWA
jgi:hypothetical protein